VKVVALKDVCRITNGGTPKSGVESLWHGGVAWLTPAEMGKRLTPYIEKTARTISQAGLANSSAKLVPPSSVILSTRAPIGHLAINETPMAFNQGCRGLTPGDKLETKYLYYFLYFSRDALDGLGTGTTFKELSSSSLANFRIPLPPLDEQRRIVAVLDKAFTGIAAATANAQKNLTNVRALFESYLETSLQGEDEDWIEKPFGECFRLKSGDALTSSAMINGPFPVFGGNGIAGYHIESNLAGDNIIIGRVGALCGNARHIQEPIWLTDNAFKVTENRYSIDNAYLKYLLNFMDLRSFARQAAQPVISNSSLKDIVIRFPSSGDRQREIVRKLDRLSAKCEEFSEGSNQKTSALTELKQALLHRAFAGELT
jgi:type I restriction enzyme, S subunit